ncbi:MAG TPA: peptidoglycan-binding protein [Actinobacteria bacterium]|nr:peptidoglycan-binding protein [Actinomycetota bacterium]
MWQGNCWASSLREDPDRVSDLTTGIQVVLNGNFEANDDVGVIDGVFGTRTRNGVAAFQRNHRLAADGIVGERTWRALREDLRWVHADARWHYYRAEAERFVELKRDRRNGRWWVFSYRAGFFVPMDRSRS